MVDSGVLSLAVPSERTRINRLIDEARHVAWSGRLMPPVSYQTLIEESSLVVDAAGGSSDERAFAMVILNNELWRPYFEAVPFERRALILPQCMKRASSCRGVIDEKGLLCAGCGACSIQRIVARAEGLGYATLVAEGTGAAVDLVREGAVDAILGVSCMDALQKSFKTVVTSAIPSLALPLLRDGCADTACDEEWLLEYLSASRSAPELRPFSVVSMRAEVDAVFRRETLARLFSMGEDNSVTASMAVDWMLTGGKRFRPLMCLMTYVAYSNESDPRIGESLLVVVECFHKASLILDDIEDGDEFRYGKKTMYREWGIALSINAADYLIGQGYSLLCKLPVSDRAKADLFALFSRMHVQCTLGQGEDILSAETGEPLGLEKIMRVFREKTGSAIMASLVAGAVAAGADERERETLRTLSDRIGMAYQMRDDLCEFREYASVGQSGGADDCATDASFPFLKSLLAEKKIVASDDAEWKRLIIEQGVEEEGWTMLGVVKRDIRASIDALNSPRLRLALTGLVNRLLERE